MSTEITWNTIPIDHAQPSSSFDVSNEEGLREAFNWTNSQPKLKDDHVYKGNKLDFLAHRLQFSQAYEFFRLNEEELNYRIH